MQRVSYTDNAGPPDNLHPCAKVWSCVATTVEGWCTVAKIKRQVEMSGVLLMGVSQTIDRLDTMVQGLDVDLQSFRELLFERKPFWNPNTANTRTKRGLIDLLGYSIKYLFGTADAQDVKRLSNICDELHVFKSRMTHAVDHQLTYIQTLDETIRQSTVDIAELTETLRSSIRNFSLQ